VYGSPSIAEKYDLHEACDLLQFKEAVGHVIRNHKWDGYTIEMSENNDAMAIVVTASSDLVTAHILFTSSRRQMRGHQQNSQISTKAVTDQEKQYRMMSSL
jgi:hypothetical protein